MQLEPVAAAIRRMRRQRTAKMLRLLVASGPACSTRAAGRSSEAVDTPGCCSHRACRAAGWVLRQRSGSTRSGGRMGVCTTGREPAHEGPLHTLFPRVHEVSTFSADYPRRL